MKRLKNFKELVESINDEESINGFVSDEEYIDNANKLIALIEKCKYINYSDIDLIAIRMDLEDYLRDLMRDLMLVIDVDKIIHDIKDIFNKIDENEIQNNIEDIKKHIIDFMKSIDKIYYIMEMNILNKLESLEFKDDDENIQKENILLNILDDIVLFDGYEEIDNYINMLCKYKEN